MSAAELPRWIDGVLHPPGEGRVSVDDLGFQLGLAVFETLAFDGHTVFFLAEHVERLRAGARAIGIPWPLPWDPARALRDYAAALGGRPAALRLTLTRGVPGRGPTLVLGARSIDVPPAEGVVVALARFRVRVGSPIEGLKSTNRLRNVLAREEAVARGAWEALLCTDEGDLCEGTVSNVFVAGEHDLATPSLERGCLPGVTRQRLLEELRARPIEGLPARERRVEPAELDGAREVFLTNSTGGVIPVRAVLDRAPRLPGPDGPVARAAAERWRAVLALQREA